LNEDLSLEKYLESKKTTLLKSIADSPDEVIILNKKSKKKGVGYNDKDFRGSKFRGTSKNKRKWQVSSLNLIIRLW
jgi:hypothetical protein